MDTPGPVTNEVIDRIRFWENGVRKDENVSDLSDGEIERRRREMEAYRKVREAVKVLADTINSYSRDSLIRTAFIDEMLHTHRYLQGSLIEEFFYALGDYGAMFKEDPVRWSDARNQFGMEQLAKLRERFRDEFFWKDK